MESVKASKRPAQTKIKSLTTSSFRELNPKTPPYYVPNGAWFCYSIFKAERDISIRGIPFPELSLAKQKMILKSFEAIFDKAFHSAESELMWDIWNKKYSDKDSFKFVGMLVICCSELNVFRQGIKSAKRRKTSIVNTSKKLRSLLENELFIKGLAQHRQKTKILEKLLQLEGFLDQCELAYDSSVSSPDNKARNKALKSRKSTAHVDFLRQIDSQLHSAGYPKDLKFIQSIFDCMQPQVNTGYTIEQIRKTLA